MKALVTGSGGFLGRALIELLRGRGVEVRGFSRTHYLDLEVDGVQHFRGDIADAEAVSLAAEGCDIVFHTAAKPGIWGPYDEYFTTNVMGTRNVIQACRQRGVGRLVHTSSPSVVFNGKDMEGVDESVPYPRRYEAHYPRTKAIAERLVLEANSPALATVALRPHLIWGPGDNHLVPRLIERAKSGSLRRIGNRPKLVDTIYIDNAAAAHVLAGEKLGPDSPIAGKTYFLSQGEPVPLWDMVNRILKAAGLAAVTQSISFKTAYAVGYCFETAYWCLRLAGEPPMTRFLARELSTAHWFNITAAKRDLGYLPSVSIEDGLERLKESLKTSAVRRRE